MATFVLIHGSWHGAWCWQKVVPLLEQKGHTVLTPDLPGHGGDKTPLKAVNFLSYVKCIEEVLHQANVPVYLVGHSMAGMILSQVAQNCPEKIQKLIYVAAFLPQNGECLSEIARRQPLNDYTAKIHAVGDEAALYLPVEAIHGFAYHHLSEEDIKPLYPLFCVEPLRPYFDKVQITPERYGKVSRAYVYCTDDHAVEYKSQQRMVRQMPCEEYTLESDHSPFYSHPEELVKILL